MYACFDRARTSAAQCRCAAAFPIKERGGWQSVVVRYHLFSYRKNKKCCIEKVRK